MRKRFLSALIIVAIFLLAVPVCAENELQSLVGEKVSFKERKTPFLYYEAYRKKGLIGYCFNTKDVVPDEKGYIGPIEILVAIDTQGKIKNLKILSHTETPQYAAKIVEDSFLSQFKGKGPTDEIILGKDINGITGATTSVIAISRILKKSISIVSSVVGIMDIQEGSQDIGILNQLKDANLYPREAKYYKVIE